VPFHAEIWRGKISGPKEKIFNGARGFGFFKQDGAIPFSCRLSGGWRNSG